MERAVTTRGWSGRTPLFLIMGGVALLATLLGFGGTYLVPVSRGEFAGPWSLHVHGALAMGWVLMFALQPILEECATVVEQQAAPGSWRRAWSPLCAFSPSNVDIAPGETRLFVMEVHAVLSGPSAPQGDGAVQTGAVRAQVALTGPAGAVSAATNAVVLRVPK